MDNSTYDILIGGKAGEGVKKAAQAVASILCGFGKQVVQADDYQSLIKGGHNFSVLAASDQPVYATNLSFDLIICFDRRSFEEHSTQLRQDGLIFYNSDDGDFPTGIPLPLTTLMKRHYSDPANVGVAAVAIFGKVTGIPIELINEIIRKQYKQNALESIGYATAIYELINTHNDFLAETGYTEGFRYLSGNQCIALGAWAAGLDFYYGYPMTPASSLLHYFAKQQDSLGVYAIHAESELAAINMAIGSALAGCRSAVGSSGGGFALMQEAFSLAGMVEAPLLCVLSSRPGPSTGVSTYSAQEDLFFALFQGHGEFTRVVASPDSFERAFRLSAELLSLAWQAQIPVILLTEKQLSEGMGRVELDFSALPDAEVPIFQAGPDYRRYEETESGVSPLAFPGQGSGAAIKWHSHEHTPGGLRTDKAEEVVVMKEKRQRKQALLEHATRKFQRVAEYGQGAHQVFAYGSTVMELREAQKHCPTPFKIVAPIYLEPFPEEELKQYRGQKAVAVEHGGAGSWGKFLQWKLNLDIINILKYDGRPFEPKDLARRLEEAFHA